MKPSAKYQQGMTLISLISLLVFIGAMALLILKILPIYLDHNKVANAMAQVKATEGIAYQSEFEIKNSFAKKFNVNYVYDVKPEDIQITKSGGYLKVTIEYEKVVPIVGNLSVLVEFNDSFEVGN
jgi:Tfp pilus assembly protein PilE